MYHTYACSFVLDVCPFVTHPELADTSHEQLLRGNGHTGFLLELCLDLGRASILLECPGADEIRACYQTTDGEVLRRGAVSQQRVFRVVSEAHRCDRRH